MLITSIGGLCSRQVSSLLEKPPKLRPGSEAHGWIRVQEGEPNLRKAIGDMVGDFIFASARAVLAGISKGWRKLIFRDVARVSKRAALADSRSGRLRPHHRITLSTTFRRIVSGTLIPKTSEKG